MKRMHLSMSQMAFISLCVVLNIVGSNLAGLSKLPIYFDSLGTVLCAMLFGPIYGMIPGLLSGLLVGFTVDVYSLFFIPVGMLIGLLAGIVYRSKRLTSSKALLPVCAFLVTLPGTLLAACICAFVFGGITSSVSSVLVQYLHQAGMNLVASVFCVQFLTDYVDRLLVLMFALFLLKYLPASITGKHKKG